MINKYLLLSRCISHFAQIHLYEVYDITITVYRLYSVRAADHFMPQEKVIFPLISCTTECFSSFEFSEEDRMLQTAAKQATN